MYTPPPRQSFWQFLSLLAARVQQLFAHSSAQSAENIQAAAALDAYGDCILRLAYSYLRSMSDAEDVLQETMIRYLRGHPFFESDSHEKAWLLRVAINLSRNRIDYNARRAHADLDDHLLEKERARSCLRLGRCKSPSAAIRGSGASVLSGGVFLRRNCASARQKRIDGSHAPSQGAHAPQRYLKGRIRF